MNKIALYKLAFSMLWRAFIGKVRKPWYTHTGLLNSHLGTMTLPVVFNETHYAFANSKHKRYRWGDDTCFIFNRKKSELKQDSIKSL